MFGILILSLTLKAQGTIEITDHPHCLTSKEALCLGDSRKAFVDTTFVNISVFELTPNHGILPRNPKFIAKNHEMSLVYALQLPNKADSINLPLNRATLQKDDSV